MLVDLETKLSSRNFSQKANEQICFSILMTGKYLKLEIEKQIRPFSTMGENTVPQFCFEIY